MNNKILSAVLCFTFAGFVAQADEVKFDISKVPAAASQTGLTFDKDIKPIFEKACYKCHGPEVEKPKGKYRADSRASVVKEHIVVPGSAAKSGLLGMIAQATEDEEMYMPPKDNKAKIAPLTKEQVALVRAWIEQGAK